MEDGALFGEAPDDGLGREGRWGMSATLDIGERD